MSTLGFLNFEHRRPHVYLEISGSLAACVRCDWRCLSLDWECPRRIGRFTTNTPRYTTPRKRAGSFSGNAHVSLPPLRTRVPPHRCTGTSRLLTSLYRAANRLQVHIPSLHHRLHFLSCPGLSSWPAGESRDLEPCGTAAEPAREPPRSSHGTFTRRGTGVVSHRYSDQQHKRESAHRRGGTRTAG